MRKEVIVGTSEWANRLIFELEEKYGELEKRDFTILTNIMPNLAETYCTVNIFKLPTPRKYLVFCDELKIHAYIEDAEDFEDAFQQYLAITLWDLTNVFPYIDELHEMGIEPIFEPKPARYIVESTKPIEEEQELYILKTREQILSEQIITSIIILLPIAIIISLSTINIIGGIKVA